MGMAGTTVKRRRKSAREKAKKINPLKCAVTSATNHVLQDVLMVVWSLELAEA